MVAKWGRECPAGKVQSPLTARCINPSGRAARSAAVRARMDGKEQTPDYLKVFGKYVVKNGKRVLRCAPYKYCVGSRLQVWNGTARRTAGRLYKSDLTDPKTHPRGRIVPKRKREAGVRQHLRNPTLLQPSLPSMAPSSAPRRGSRQRRQPARLGF